jgi:Flp pilus assembly CpaF family ATPase
MQARANVLVVGPAEPATSTFVASLAQLAQTGDRVGMMIDDADAALGHAYVVSFPVSDDGALRGVSVRAAARLRLDRLIVCPMTGPVAVSLLEAVADGAEGVLAGTYAPSLRQALSRLLASASAAHDGLRIEALSRMLADTFDVAVELLRAPEGKVRVSRVAELLVDEAKGVLARDLFGADGDGPHPAGTPPRLVAELGMRGVRLDPALFRKPAGR